MHKHIILFNLDYVICSLNISICIYSVHYILCITLYAFYSMHLILCITFYTLHYLNSILCIAFVAFHSMHYILCISLYPFHSMNFILYLIKSYYTLLFYEYIHCITLNVGNQNNLFHFSVSSYA